jgi:hypothetical protein
MYIQTLIPTLSMITIRIYMLQSQESTCLRSPVTLVHFHFTSIPPFAYLLPLPPGSQDPLLPSNLLFLLPSHISVTIMPHALPSSPISLSPAASDDNVHLTDEEKTHLSALLTHKLRGLPHYHIPSLTLTDILNTTPRTHLPSIPADINLTFFLRNRSLIDTQGVKPVKDEVQSIEITRTIFYYRLDAIHQFQRYHDAVRWNITIFTALLTATSKSSTSSDALSEQLRSEQTRKSRDTGELNISLTPAAKRFITYYLAAVLEHHTTTTSFERREAFIRLWKAGIYELFVVRKSWAKKALQRALKRLSTDWEAELDAVQKSMRRDVYNATIAPFVGSILPGRKDQRVSSASLVFAPDSGYGDGNAGVEMEDLRSSNQEHSGLLEALRVPCSVTQLNGEEGGTGWENEEGVIVCDLQTAVSAVQKVKPRDILPVLIRLFPHVEDEDGEL